MTVSQALTKSLRINTENPTESAPIVDVGIGIVVRRTASKYQTSGPGASGAYDILITRRPEHTVYGGYWELPGGKAEPGEAIEDCIRRELLEEVGVSVEVIRTLPEVVHAYAHATVRLHPRLCRLTPDSPAPRNLHVEEHLWTPLSQITNHRFPEGNAAIIASVEIALRGGIALL